MGCCGVQVSERRDAGLVTQVGKQRRNAGTRLTGEEKKRFCRCAGRRQRAERLRLGGCLWSGRGRLSLAGRARGKDAGRYGKAALERKKAWECSGQVREVDSSWGRGGGLLTGKGQGPLGGSGARAGRPVGAGPGPGPGLLFCLLSCGQVPLALHCPSGCLSNSLGPIQAPAPLFHKQIRELRRTGRLLWGLVLVVPGKAACRETIS